MSDNIAIVPQHDLLPLTTDIVSAFLSHNTVSAGEITGLIRNVHGALANLGQPETGKAPKLEPAVSVRSSIKPDYLVCLEDGAKLKMLKRYLRTNFDMTPDEYRAKWDLPRDYPMVAPNYAEQRKNLAVKIGLGRKRTNVAPAKDVTAALTKARQKLSIKTGSAES